MAGRPIARRGLREVAHRARKRSPPRTAAATVECRPRRDRWRADRQSPPARADAVAERRIQIAEALSGVAGIDEGRDPPVAAPAFQPSDVLDRGHGQRAAADDGTALLDAEALEVVAADRQGPAGAEEELVRHCIRRFGDDRSQLAAQDQHVARTDRQILDDAAECADEHVVDRWAADADGSLQLDQVAVTRIRDVIEVATGPRVGRR